MCAITQQPFRVEVSKVAQASIRRTLCIYLYIHAYEADFGNTRGQFSDPERSQRRQAPAPAAAASAAAPITILVL